ncbi:hypothetical protein ECPA23_1476, partial [Escherichia coli PA23]
MRCLSSFVAPITDK